MVNLQACWILFIYTKCIAASSSRLEKGFDPTQFQLYSRSSLLIRILETPEEHLAHGFSLS